MYVSLFSHHCGANLTQTDTMAPSGTLQDKSFFSNLQNVLLILAWAWWA